MVGEAVVEGEEGVVQLLEDEGEGVAEGDEDDLGKVAGWHPGRYEEVMVDGRWWGAGSDLIDKIRSPVTGRSGAGRPSLYRNDAGAPKPEAQAGSKRG